MPAAAQHGILVEPLVGLQADADDRDTGQHGLVQQDLAELHTFIEAHRDIFAGLKAPRQLGAAQHQHRVEPE